jgi:hypothetical protein
MVKLHWSITGRAWSNVFHGRYGTPPAFNSALAENIFGAIKAEPATTAFFAHLGNTVSFTGVSVKDLNAANHAEFLSTSLPMLGTGAPPIAPLSVALVVTLRTAQAGQGFRGRTYLAGLLEGDLATPTSWDSIVGTLAVDFVRGIDDSMGAAQLPMAVAQHALDAGTHANGTPFPARPADSVDVVSYDIANARIDSQRRRTGR